MPPPSDTSSRHGPAPGLPIDEVLFVLLVVVSIAVFAVHAVQYGWYIADDAAITFAYAKNLARGHGLVLNPGTDPVEGYSNFAWLLVVMPFCAGGADPTVAVKVLSFILASLTCLLLALAGRRIAAGSRVEAHTWLAALASVGLAACAPYVVWASAGMENAFYCALFVAAVLLYLRESFVLCALTLVVLSLTRFEAIGVAGLFAVHRAGVLLFTRRRPSRRDTAAAALLVALYAGYLTWHWWYFRALVPNTYLSKSAAVRIGTMESVWADLNLGWTYASGQLIRPYRFVVGAPLAAIGLLALRPRMLTLTALLLAGVFGLALLTGGDFYPEFRLGTLVLPLWFMLVVEGTRVLLSRVRVRAAVALAASIPIAVMCQPSIAVASNWGLGPISMGRLKQITADRFAELAKSIRTRPITVMESDIGNVAYFTDFGVLDLGGLSNLEIARNGFYGPLFLHYVFEEMKPDIIHLHHLWAANANVPIALIERDYQSIEGPRTGPYAAGWYVRRDLEHPNGATKYVGPSTRGERLHADDFGIRWIELSHERWMLYPDQPSLPPTATGGRRPAAHAPFPSAESGAADLYAEVKRQCDAGNAACHANDALARQALARAESFRRAGQLAFAFEWYATAWEADRRNVLALRAREDMRTTIAGEGVASGRGVGSACPFELGATSATASGGGSTGTVTVTTDKVAAAARTCIWTAASNNPFITVTSGANGTVSGTVAYTVRSNPGPPRTGTITIAGQTLTISQGASVGLVASFQMFDPGTQVTATTECRFRSASGSPSTCHLQSTSSALGGKRIVNYAWTVVYTYDTVKTLTQSGAASTIAITDRCGGLQSTADGASSPLSVTLTVTDNLGATATATVAGGSQAALVVRMFTCGS